MIKIQEKYRTIVQLLFTTIFLTSLLLPYFGQLVLVEDSNSTGQSRLETLDTYGYQSRVAYVYGVIITYNLFLSKLQNNTVQILTKILTLILTLITFVFVQLSINWSSGPYHADEEFGFYIPLVLIAIILIVKFKENVKMNTHNIELR